jgi:hypothetical protein
MEIVITAPAMKWSASFGFKFVNLYLLRACNLDCKLWNWPNLAYTAVTSPMRSLAGQVVGPRLEHCSKCGPDFGPAYDPRSVQSGSVTLGSGTVMQRRREELIKKKLILDRLDKRPLPDYSRKSIDINDLLAFMASGQMNRQT